MKSACTTPVWPRARGTLFRDGCKAQPGTRTKPGGLKDISRWREPPECDRVKTEAPAGRHTYRPAGAWFRYRIEPVAHAPG
jgi:hypothetical protein